MAVVLLAAMLGGAGGVWAAEFDFAKFNQELGLRFAYGRSSEDGVNFYTFLPRWGISLVKPGHQLIGGLGVSFIVEGTISVADAQDTGWELGVAPLFQVSLPIRRSALVFIEGGAGVIYQSIKSHHTPNNFNFSPQVGAGIDFALTPHLGLVLAYRLRHTSNAGLREPNPNFNVNFLQMGLSYHY